MIKPVTKTFQRAGKWIEKVTKTEILLCGCGNKYLKTRDNQKTCVRCMSAQPPRKG